MPNYRLMPEANGTDILEDMSDFWSWVTGGKLQAYLSGLEGDNATEVDTERIWVHGESAGTYHALPSDLLSKKSTLTKLFPHRRVPLNTSWTSPSLHRPRRLGRLSYARLRRPVEHATSPTEQSLMDSQIRREELLQPSSHPNICSNKSPRVAEAR